MKVVLIMHPLVERPSQPAASIEAAAATLTLFHPFPGSLSLPLSLFSFPCGGCVLQSADTSCPLLPSAQYPAPLRARYILPMCIRRKTIRQTDIVLCATD